LTIVLLITGLLGLGYEVLGVRVLSQFLENTVYTFVAVLTVYLIGTSAGAGVFQRFFRSHSSRYLLTTLLCLLSSACLLGVITLPLAGRLYSWSRAAWGDSRVAVALAEMLAASMIFFLPTLLMGATFSHLVQSAKRPEGGIGRAVAFNTLGGALAPLVFGVILLPLGGAKWSLITTAVGYLALIPELPRRHTWLLLTPAALLLGAITVDLRGLQLPERVSIVAYEEGAFASVSVVEDDAGYRTLRVNNRFQMGGTATISAERRQAQIPLLLHSAPRSALFLGVGTGITFGAAVTHAGLEADGVELLPEVIEMMKHFSPENANPLHHPRLRMFAADARRFVRATDSTYDVIVADLFHPAMDGAGALYTREHFQAIRQRLATNGLFCQWLPLYQMDGSMLRVIVRTFLDVFPEAQAWLLRFNIDTPVIGLVGFVNRPASPSETAQRWLNQGELALQLRQLVLTDAVQLFGCLLADAGTLASYAADAPLNTDDQPRVIFEAPHASYRRDSQPGEQLLVLLKAWRPDLHSVFVAGASAEQIVQRVQNFIIARDLYLRGLLAEGEQQLPEALDFYLAGSRASADFTWGYARCLTIAKLFARSDPERARVLLERLIEAQPAQAAARELLEQLPAPERK
jgi:spermidine synthase